MANRIKKISTPQRLVDEPAEAPTYSELVQALEEATATLRETKHAFRSKPVGDLRRKLEAIIARIPRS